MTMERYRASYPMAHRIQTNLARIISGHWPYEMTLDSSANHSVNQGSFHEVVGFRHLRNLSFCGLWAFPGECFRMAFHMFDFSIFI